MITVNGQAGLDKISFLCNDELPPVKSADKKPKNQNLKTDGKDRYKSKA